MIDEGPATVTLTDDEHDTLRKAVSRDRWAQEYNSVAAAVERIVAARVGALTADLAAAREETSAFRIMAESSVRIATERQNERDALMYLYRVWHGGRWIVPWGRPCEMNERECMNALHNGKRVEVQYITDWRPM